MASNRKVVLGSDSIAASRRFDGTKLKRNSPSGAIAEGISLAELRIPSMGIEMKTARNADLTVEALYKKSHSRSSSATKSSGAGPRESPGSTSPGHEEIGRAEGETEKPKVPTERASAQPTSAGATPASLEMPKNYRPPTLVVAMRSLDASGKSADAPKMAKKGKKAMKTGSIYLKKGKKKKSAKNLTLETQSEQVTTERTTEQMEESEAPIGKPKSPGKLLANAKGKGKKKGKGKAKGKRKGAKLKNGDDNNIEDDEMDQGGDTDGVEPRRSSCCCCC